jgi:tRNA threonylcarbamoyladenosine modification (KEOPS) complex  Pcc1 subunit
MNLKDLALATMKKSLEREIDDLKEQIKEGLKLEHVFEREKKSNLEILKEKDNIILKLERKIHELQSKLKNSNAEVTEMQDKLSQKTDLSTQEVHHLQTQLSTQKSEYKQKQKQLVESKNKHKQEAERLQKETDIQKQVHKEGESAYK